MRKVTIKRVVTRRKLLKIMPKTTTQHLNHNRARGKSKRRIQMLMQIRVVKVLTLPSNQVNNHHHNHRKGVAATRSAKGITKLINKPRWPQSKQLHL